MIIEMCALIERACDLIARNISERHLEVLQKRIEGLLLQHIKAATCNDGVTKRMFGVKEKLMENNTFYCMRCMKLKTMDQFQVDARTKRVNICSSCAWVDKSSQPWTDLPPYRFILKRIRNYERLHGAPSSIAFILKDKDIYHLVNNIWHCHSALSECADVYKLRMCRWRKEENWSPWNCFLLTKEEVKSHLGMENLEVYGEEFRSQVFSKHALAKKHFPHLIDIDHRFTKRANEDYRLDGVIEYNKFVRVSSKEKIYFSCH